jgi:cytochrome P450
VAEALRYPMTSDATLEPPTEWARLREQCPVAKVTLASGDEAMLVTRYDDVKQVLSDSRFTRPSGGKGARVADTESGGVFNSEMANVLPQHGEGHLRWRRMIGKWFTAKRMNALRPAIAAMAEQLIDDMVATCSACRTPTGSSSPTGRTCCSA